MGTRVPVQHYGIRSAESYIGSSLHDLNTADASPPPPQPMAGDIEGISDVDRDAVTEDSLDNGDETNSVDCLQEPYRHSMALVGVDEDRSGLESSGHPSRSPYGILTADDILPIETARVRFLEIFVDNFIKDHVIEVENPDEDDFGFAHDKFNKRKQKDVRYEGDARFVLPLMYVANLYEALICEVNVRLTSLDGIREKNIGVALEAAGGLYRKLARKFPRKGLYSYRRRELATSVETRTRFPELVVQEEKRVRFVVVNGLEIVEKPTNMSLEDVEWFKRLTGRHEVSISSRDYKFYSPRHKYRRVSSSTVPSNPSLPQNQAPQSSSKHRMHSLSHQSEFQSLHQAQQTIHQNQHPIQYSRMHQCQQGSNLSDISGSQQHSTIPQHMTCIQTLSGGNIGGRLHLLPTSPAKFCDQCGTPYLRETSKFCSECGTKRLGI